MAATLIYMLLPSQAGRGMIGMFSRVDDTARSDGLRRSVIMKLDYAAKALGNVSESVEAVSKKLSKTCAPDINGVYKKVRDDVCRGCGLKVYCWERNYSDTMNAFNDLTQYLRTKGEVEAEDFSNVFSSHCSRLPAVVSAVNRYYCDFITRESAEQRIAQVLSLIHI